VLRAGLSVAILAVLARACRRRLDPARQPLALAAEIGLVQIAMLALSGISWKDHFIALLLPYTVLLAYLADARYPDAARTRVKRWLLVSFVLCTLTCDIITPRGADYAEAFGLILFGALAAAGGLLAVRRALDTFPESMIPHQTEPARPRAGQRNRAEDGPALFRAGARSLGMQSCEVVHAGAG
jgi:hypothetical protein